MSNARDELDEVGTGLGGHPREHCGVVGIYGHPRAAEQAYLGLFALQHRGQESAGMVVHNGSELTAHLGMGLVSEVFPPDRLAELKGPAMIGHVRYSTTGCSDLKNAQPILVDYARGQLAVAHNGNLVNAHTLRRELEGGGSIFQTTTDSEIIIHLMARPFMGPPDDVLKNVMRRIQGAFSLTMLTPEMLIGVRDPQGFRPLSIGQVDGAYMLASESCAFDLVGAELVRDVEPGEIVIIDQSGLRSVRYARQSSQAMCIFEYVYFARPDSIIGGKTCHTVRKELGRALAREYPVEADIVMPVPDSGNSAALGFAEESGIPFEMGYIRNHYVGRTFISPSQIDRDIKVRVKLNVIPDVVRDKRVVIIDDSIIRGTTTFSRVAELKKAGAKEVHVRISCPPTRFPCFYGIDFPSQTQLIAARHTVEEIRAFLHADSLGYLSLEGMIAACGGRRGFCCACYTGEYPVQIDEPVHKAMMERVRGGHSDDAPAAVKATMEAEQANGGNGEREAAARADQGEQAPADVPECAPDAPGASGSAATDDLFTLE